MVLKKTLILCLYILLLFLVPDAVGQNRKSRNTRAYYKNHYSPAPKAKKQCALLLRKKHRKRKKKNHGSFLSVLFGNSRSRSNSKPEVEPKETPPSKPTSIAQKTAENKLKKPDENQKKDLNDELANKELPEPVSTKHEEIRERVKKRLQQNTNGEPIELDPLFFVYDDAEFSMVDMEPFLIAVEYALQGRIILIEGHTDSHGQDDYNVKLSIERVEKIRQLMHDMGVPDERISIVGYGEEVAEYNNSTADGRQKNRRVDFKVF